MPDNGNKKFDKLVLVYLAQINKISRLNRWEEEELGRTIRKHSYKLAKEKEQIKELIDDSVSDAKKKFKIQIKIRRHQKKITTYVGKLVEANLRFGWHMAKKYRWSSLPMMTLIQLSSLGLLKAAERYDPDSYNTKFASYAGGWIRAEIRNEIAKRVKDGMVSLDKVISSQGSDATTLHDEVQDPNAVSPGIEAEQNSRRELVQEAILSKLEPIEREVVELRFGLNGCDPHSFEEIAKLVDGKYGKKVKTRKRAHQIFKKARQKLRTHEGLKNLD